MTDFETDFFKPQEFTVSQLAQYLNSAKRDLLIARQTDIAEVRFKFSYEALIKFGIYLIAKRGYKVRSSFGHHAKIIEKMSGILRNDEVALIGNIMRKNRNADFYDGGLLITDKESNEYLEFIIQVLGRANA